MVKCFFLLVKFCKIIFLLTNLNVERNSFHSWTIINEFPLCFSAKNCFFVAEVCFAEVYECQLVVVYKMRFIQICFIFGALYSVVENYEVVPLNNFQWRVRNGNKCKYILCILCDFNLYSFFFFLNTVVEAFQTVHIRWKKNTFFSADRIWKIFLKYLCFFRLNSPHVHVE